MFVYTSLPTRMTSLSIVPCGSDFQTIVICRILPENLQVFVKQDGGLPLNSELYIYIWSKNFSHSVNEKSEAK